MSLATSWEFKPTCLPGNDASTDSLTMFLLLPDGDNNAHSKCAGGELQFSNRIGTYHGRASILLHINTCSSIDRREGLAAVLCIL